MSPLQKLTTEVSSANAHLFAPRAAYRFTDIEGNVSTNDDQTAGQNPPYGAAINYWLKSAHDSASRVSISILDAAGNTIRTVRGTGRAGINRVYWNLRNDSSAAVRMRTKPSFNAEFEMSRDSTRVAPQMTRMSVLMPPGSYTVRLTADGQTYDAPLEVRRDPNTTPSDQEIRASTDMLLAIQKDLSTTANILGSIERLRAQLQRVSGGSDVRAQADAVEKKLMALEENIVDLRMTGRGQDEVRYPVKLGGQLNYLAGGISASDFSPTDQQREVQLLLSKQVADTRAALDRIQQTDVATFNQMLSAKGLKPIDTK